MSKIKGEFYRYLFTVFICLGAASVLFYLILYFKGKTRTAAAGSVDREKIFVGEKRKILKKIKKNPFLGKFIHETALKISVFNTKSTEFNETAALLGISAAALITVFFSAVMIAVTFPLWYMGCVYSLIFAGGMCLMFAGASEISVYSFTKNMPETLRILNSRYAGRGNIMKAIAASMDDFHPIIRREMVRIYDALKQNDMEKISSTFAETEEKYSGEYVTLMLELIRHAYYNGGDEVVRVQFDVITEDVIEELENRKDVRQAAVGYIIMAIAFIPLLPLALVFNRGVIGEESAAFYGSLTGKIYAAVFFILVFVLILTIFFAERREK